MKKNKLLLALIAIVVSLGLLLTSLTLSRQQPVIQQNIQNNYYQGTVSTGNDIGKDYCSEGVYFTTQGKAYLLRKNTPDRELLEISDININITSLELELPPTDTNYCEALMCDCEEHAVVLSELSI